MQDSLREQDIPLLVPTDYSPFSLFSLLFCLLSPLLSSLSSFLFPLDPSILKLSISQKYWRISDLEFQMRRLASLAICVTVVLVGQSSAHFLLQSPPTIGFDDSLEGTPPCGSFSVDFSTDNVTDFHVGGDFIAMTSIHPMATWLFRATLDQTASGNWTDLLPAVVQTGLGDYCETDITVPSTWAGSKGVIGIVQDAPDGILYQVGLFLSQSPSPFTNAESYSVRPSILSPAQSRLPVSART